MGLSYRKRKGPVSFSVSKRGPRVSVGSGCLMQMLAALVAIAAASRRG